MSIPLHPNPPESANGTFRAESAQHETAYPSFDFRPWNDERIAVYATLDAALSKALVEAVKALDEMKRTVEQDAHGVIERLQYERSSLDSEVNQLRAERNRLLDSLAEVRAQIEAEKARQMAAEREVETMLSAATTERDRIQRDAQRMTAQMDDMGRQLQATFQQRFNEMWSAFSKSLVNSDGSVVAPPAPALGVIPQPQDEPQLPEQMPVQAEPQLYDTNVQLQDEPHPQPTTIISLNSVNEPRDEAGVSPTDTQEPPDPLLEWLASYDTPTADDVEPFNSQPYTLKTTPPAHQQPPVESTTPEFEETANPSLSDFDELPTVRAPENYDQPQKAEDGWETLADVAQQVREYVDDPTKRPAEIVLKESAEEENKLAAELAEVVEEGNALGAPVSPKPEPEKDMPNLTNMRVENVFAAPADDVVLEPPAPPAEDHVAEQLLRAQNSTSSTDWLPKNFTYNIGIANDLKPGLRNGLHTPQPPAEETEKPVVTTEVTITELQGFSLLAVERRMRSLPGVRKVTVTDFRRGELSLSVQHNADLHLHTLLPTIPDLNLRLISQIGSTLRFAQKQ